MILFCFCLYVQLNSHTRGIIESRDCLQVLSDSLFRPRTDIGIQHKFLFVPSHYVSNILAKVRCRPAMQKRIFGHMRTTKAQISLRICAFWSGHSLSANRITGYYRMYDWRAKDRMIICACAGWSESAHFAHVRRHFLAWRSPYCWYSTRSMCDVSRWFNMYVVVVNMYREKHWPLNSENPLLIIILKYIYNSIYI